LNWIYFWSFLWCRRLIRHLVSFVFLKSELSKLLCYFWRAWSFSSFLSDRGFWSNRRVRSNWRFGAIWWSFCYILKFLSDQANKFINLFVLLSSFFDKLPQLLKMFFVRFTSTSTLRRNLGIANMTSSNAW